MNEEAVQAPRRILIVEDDASMRKQLSVIFSRYGNAIELHWAENAGEALSAIEAAGSHFDALVLDLMMPYGSAREKLPGGDPLELDTGLHVLDYVRRAAPIGALPLWVAVITARSGLAVARRATELLAGSGTLYLKPFDTFRFEDDVMNAIGVRSLVPAELLDDSITHVTEERL